MIADCTKSLADVERRIPTVVLSAHVGGRSVVEARVREGSTVLVQQLDGRSLELEPGVHDLVLERPVGEEVRARFVVEEGARLQRLDFEVPLPVAPAPAARPPSTASPRSRVPAWLRPAGTVATVSGLAVVGVGAGFGLAAWRSRESANCDARGLCDAGPLERAHTESTVSTVGFVVGGALVGLGLAALGVSVWGARSAPPRVP
jgi:hypothetical protein